MTKEIRQKNDSKRKKNNEKGLKAESGKGRFE